MPSLIKFFVVILFLVALVYGSMFALSIFVEPPQKEISQRVPVQDIFKN